MGIKTQRYGYSTKLQNIRRLMVDNNEKFRLAIRDEEKETLLLYAKGKIKFNYNIPLDGSNNPIDIRFYSDSAYDEVYAFYGDGFYHRDSSSLDSFKKWNEEKLSKIKYPYYIQWEDPYKVNPSDDPNATAATFLGWWTKKDGGTQIEFISQVASSTNLFDYKKETTLPEITLYAHWKVKTYTITVHNITKQYHYNPNKYVYSSFEYGGQTITGQNSSKAISNIKWGTNVKNWLSNNIKNPQYKSWASKKAANLFTNKETQKTFKQGVQKFLGWATPYRLNIYHPYIGENLVPKYGTDPIINGVHYHWGTNENPSNYDGLILNNTVLNKSITVFPQFETLVIYPKMNLPNKKVFKGKYSLYKKPAYWRNFCWPSENAPGLSGFTEDGSWYKRDGKLYKWSETNNNADYSFSFMNYAPYSSTIILKFVEA